MTPYLNLFSYAIIYGILLGEYCLGMRGKYVK